MASHTPVPSSSSPTDPFWLARHRNGFLDSLALQGYAARTIENYRRMIDRVCAETETRGLGPDTLDAAVIRALAQACPRTGTPYMERELAMATHRFTDYLIQAGVAAAVNRLCPHAVLPNGSARSWSAGSGATGGCTGIACEPSARCCGVSWRLAVPRPERRTI